MHLQIKQNLTKELRNTILNGCRFSKHSGVCRFCQFLCNMLNLISVPRQVQLSPMGEALWICQGSCHSLSADNVLGRAKQSPRMELELRVWGQIQLCCCCLFPQKGCSEISYETSWLIWFFYQLLKITAKKVLGNDYSNKSLKHFGRCLIFPVSSCFFS